MEQWLRRRTDDDAWTDHRLLDVSANSTAETLGSCDRRTDGMTTGKGQPTPIGKVTRVIGLIIVPHLRRCVVGQRLQPPDRSIIYVIIIVYARPMGCHTARHR